jgi:hypothetical protein
MTCGFVMAFRQGPDRQRTYPNGKRACRSARPHASLAFAARLEGDAE